MKPTQIARLRPNLPRKISSLNVKRSITPQKKNKRYIIPCPFLSPSQFHLISYCLFISISTLCSWDPNKVDIMEFELYTQQKKLDGMSNIFHGWIVWRHISWPERSSLFSVFLHYFSWKYVKLMQVGGWRVQDPQKQDKSVGHKNSKTT